MVEYKFIHINKCGGNSIHLTLNKIYIKIRGGKKFKYSQIHDNGKVKATKYSIADGVKVFIFVRDPIERFLSSYRYNGEREWNKAFEKYNCSNLNEILEKEEIMDEFMNSASHLRYGISEYLSPESIKGLHEDGYLFFVGTTENIKEDFNKLIKIMDLEKYDLQLPHLNKTEKKGLQITSENVERIKKYFSKDYDCLRTLDELGYLPEGYLKFKDSYFV